MFTISNSTDYALLLVSYISKKKNGASISAVVKDTKLPLRYISRIASTLSRENILQSKEGKNGGYMLKKPLNKILLKYFLSIFEGPILVTKCCDDHCNCSYKSICSHGSRLRKTLQKTFERSISKLTLKDIM